MNETVPSLKAIMFGLNLVPSKAYEYEDSLNKAKNDPEKITILRDRLAEYINRAKAQVDNAREKLGDSLDERQKAVLTSAEAALADDGDLTALLKEIEDLLPEEEANEGEAENEEVEETEIAQPSVADLLAGARFKLELVKNLDPNLVAAIEDLMKALELNAQKTAEVREPTLVSKAAPFKNFLRKTKQTHQERQEAALANQGKQTGYRLFADMRRQIAGTGTIVLAELTRGIKLDFDDEKHPRIASVVEKLKPTAEKLKPTIEKLQVSARELIKINSALGASLSEIHMQATLRNTFDEALRNKKGLAGITDPEKSRDVFAILQFLEKVGLVKEYDEPQLNSAGFWEGKVRGYEEEAIAKAVEALESQYESNPIFKAYIDRQAFFMALAFGGELAERPAVAPADENTPAPAEDVAVPDEDVVPGEEEVTAHADVPALDEDEVVGAPDQAVDVLAGV